jgi:hypothetical protein
LDEEIATIETDKVNENAMHHDNELDLHKGEEREKRTQPSILLLLQGQQLLTTNNDLAEGKEAYHHGFIPYGMLTAVDKAISCEIKRKEKGRYRSQPGRRNWRF